MIKTIRPKHVFSLLEGQMRPVLMPLPTICSPSGSLTAIEVVVLMAIVNIVDPQTVFEFGTFMGLTTCSLAMNTRPDALVYTFDLPLGSAPPETFENPLSHDNKLREKSTTEGAVYLDILEPEYKSKVRRIYGNSEDFDSKSISLQSSIDLIFVDGGHDTKTLTSDTENAFQMARSTQSVIVWHDYNNPIDEPVTWYLDKLSETVPIVHVGDTRIALTGLSALMEIG